MAQRVGPIGSTTPENAPTWTDYELMPVERLLLTPGVFERGTGKLAVAQRGAGANLSVDVAAGEALVEITNVNLDGSTYNVPFYNTATQNLTIAAADATNPRIDIVVLTVDVSDDPDAAAADIANLHVVTGTPAGSPSAPATPANSLLLARVAVAAGATSVVTGNITDYRTYVEFNDDVMAGAARTANLSSTVNGKGASLIGVEDSGGNFAGTTVEAVLAEIQTELLAEINSKIDIVNIGFYGDENDSAPTWTTGASLDPATEKRYTSATLPVSQTLTVSSVNTPLVIHNTGNVTINGTVDLNGKGGAGGAGRASSVGNGANGTDGHTLISGWVSGGGAGGVRSASNVGGGGGGGSLFAAGTAGQSDSGGTGGAAGAVFSTIQAAFLANILRGVACGGGGGGGALGDGFTSGHGGDGGAGGGAMVWYIGGNLTLGAASVIRANGVDGGASTSGARKAGGGGGAGGTIVIIVAGSITNSGATLSATAGAAGISSEANGGVASAGKVIIYSLSTGTLIAS